MTSSDLIDTSFAYQLKQASDILLDDLDRILAAFKKRIEEHRSTICIGRSHGIHAEPTTFGLKLAGHYCAFKRARERLVHAKEEIAVCAMSGAVGTYATLDPAIESYVADKLGLKHEMVSTQVIPRDRHAMFFATLGVIASSVENFAVEIRHLQRSEVREAQEFFSKGQKGSSAMPHKRNPILSATLTGLARIVRRAVIPAMENVALWHERDISHSSVERMIAPDATVTLDFALHRLSGLIENLLVYPDAMQSNLEKLGGLVFSQRAMLALTQNGVSREDAYVIIQRNAMKVCDCDASTTLKEFLSQDNEVTDALSSEIFEDIFDYNHYTKNIDTVIDRAIK
jgi:adenylosuccinate lyase